MIVSNICIFAGKLVLGKRVLMPTLLSRGQDAHVVNGYKFKIHDSIFMIKDNEAYYTVDARIYNGHEYRSDFIGRLRSGGYVTVYSSRADDECFKENTRPERMIYCLKNKYRYPGNVSLMI